MKAFLAVFGRELRQRQFLLLAAGVAALVATGIPLLRGLHGDDALEVRSWIALAFAALLGLGVAAALGIVMIPGAIASRRIGFDLARPLSTFAIWAGRTAAGTFLAGVAAAIALLPIWIGGLGATPEPWLSHRWPLLGLGLILLVYGLAQAVATVVLSRSPLILADCVAAAGVGLIVFVSIRKLASVGAGVARWVFVFHWRFVSLATAPVLALALALFVASLAAVGLGRVSIRRAHRALSATLWCLAGIGSAALWAYALWVCAAGTADLTWIGDAKAPAHGTWIYVDGIARGGEFEFLYDTTTRRSHSIRPRQLLFSDDGRYAVWIDEPEVNGTRGLHWANLSESEPAESHLRFGKTLRLLAVSPDGEYIAVQEGDVFSVYSLARDRLLGSVRTGRVAHAWFEAEDRVRLICPSGEERGEILRWDIGQRSLQRLGVIESAIERGWMEYGPRHERLLIEDSGTKRLGLFDATSGALIRIVGQNASWWTRGRFFEDGRIVVADKDQDAHFVDLFSPDGDPLTRIPVEGFFELGGEIRPGELALGMGYQFVIAELRSGRTKRLGEGMPILGTQFGPYWGMTDIYPAGSLATRLFFRFFDRGRALVLIDPETGEQTAILGRGAR